MSGPHEDAPTGGVTIGVCTTGASPGAAGLVQSLLDEGQFAPVELRKLVVVASECPNQVVSDIHRIQEQDNRVDLIVEDARYGKAEAINRILARVDGRFIALVNSDAVPEPGAIARLLKMADADGRIGAVSAMPVTQTRRGLTSLLVDFMWGTHNECSLALNHMNLSNHSSDELVVFRSTAIERLPRNLVNDGAFLAASARRRGYSVRFCPSARVKIQTPRRISDLISQRRRILFGHGQVWRKMGTPPKTIESLLLFSTPIGLGLLVKTLVRHPRFLLVLPVAAISELLASLLSIADTLRSSKRHAVWRRFT
jgi:cellulose synthase/poly-beta-1,6-N-acetylglucosamine synthase-like glycosyltransferase